MSFMTKVANILLAIALMGFLMYPFTVHSGNPYRIEHESRSGSVSSGEAENFHQRLLTRQYDDAKRSAEKAQSERYRAYLPTSPVFEPSRQDRINRAESNLDNATSRLKSIEYKIYLNKRIQESEARDRKIEKMRKN